MHLVGILFPHIQKSNYIYIYAYFTVHSLAACVNYKWLCFSDVQKGWRILVFNLFRYVIVRCLSTRHHQTASVIPTEEGIQKLDIHIYRVGRDSSVGIVTCYGLDGQRSIPGGGEVFRTRPDRPWGPPSLLYNGYRVFPGVKRPGRGVDHPQPSSAEVKKRVELYLYSPSGSSWPILG